MEENIIIPLRSAFRVWGRGALEEAYRHKLKMEDAEPGSSERLLFSIQYYFWLDLARRTAWREMACEPFEVTGLLSPVGPKSQREPISAELLKTLIPNHGHSSAKSDQVEHFDIQVRGKPPINWPAAIGRDELIWGPFDSEFIQANDYEDITFKGEPIRLQEVQARMVRELHEAHLEGRPALAIKRLVPNGHISSYFKGPKAKLLRYPRRGFVQLDLD